MFKNVGKEIKEDLSGMVLASTVLYIAISVVGIFFLYQCNFIERAAMFGTGIIAVPFFGLIGNIRARRRVMYRYAYGELVETVQKINKQLEKLSAAEKGTDPSTGA